MSVNVNRSVSDQFYRYKMPRLIAKVTTHYCFVFFVFFRFVLWGEKNSIRIVVGVGPKFPESCRKKCLGVNITCGFFLSIQVEGKGNGIKTVIVNMVDVAKALNRPPTCE